MSVTATEIKAVLVADAGVGGVNTLLTGGIYTFDDTGRLGIGRLSTAAAFDSTSGLLKPCCVVKARDENPDQGVVDPANVSYRQVFELWFYDDGASTTATITAAISRAFTLLNEQMIGTDKNVLLWAGNFFVGQRDKSLDYAHVRRSDYAVRALM